MHHKSPNPETGDLGARRVSEEDLPSLSPKSPDVNNRSHHLNVEAVLQLLQERWPLCFSIHERGRRPLKVGIFTDIMKELDGAVTHAELAKAIGCYVGNRIYLKKIKTGAARVGLDGLPAGKVTESEELNARKLLGGSANPPESPGSRATRFALEVEYTKQVRQEFES